MLLVRQSFAALLLGLAAGGVAVAQTPLLPGLPNLEAAPPAATPEAPPASVEAAANPEAELDALFARLSKPDQDDWEEVQDQIVRIWSRSGSASMDLLLRRGEEALKAGDTALAIERLSALTDHAPDFAEGWNARATAFYMVDEYSLALSDIGHALALNPRHFVALTGLASIYEQMGEPERALRAIRAARALNPNQPEVQETVRRLEAAAGATEL